MQTILSPDASPMTPPRSRRGWAAVWALTAILALPLGAQSASLSGMVLLDPSERPLANAEIMVTDMNRSTRSDSLGNFSLTGLAAGKHGVIVRLVGYEPFTADITFGARQKVEADFLLKPITTKLAKVDVKARATNGPWAIKLAEFEERRALGNGKFLTADYFEKNDGRALSSFLVEKLAGLRVMQSNGRRWLASARGGRRPASSEHPYEKVPPACYMNVVVNGMVKYNGSQSLFDIDQLNTRDVIGLEFYSTANTPLQYNTTGGQSGDIAGASCGTVVIWTKGG